MTILLLTKRSHGKDWRPIHGKEIGSEIRKTWKEIIKGSKKYSIFCDSFGTKVDDFHAKYPRDPRNRPIYEESFGNYCGCIYDLDGAQTRNDSYLVAEVNMIPSHILVCCVSAQTTGCRKKLNFMGRNISENNMDRVIEDFIGMLLIWNGSYCYPEKFKKIAKENLEAFLMLFGNDARNELEIYIKSIRPI